MSASPRPADRPFLRLFDPDMPANADWTIRKAFDYYRWPRLQHLKSASDGQRWVRYWEQFEAELGLAQRTINPLSLKDIGSRELEAFQLWLQEEGRFPPPKGASSVNKAVKEIVLIIDLAARDGCEVKHVRPPRHLPVRARPRYYFDDAAIERLWSASERMSWPLRYVDRAHAGRSFRGSGMPPADFWRCLIVLLRIYGMRVQDLVAYAAGKQPMVWADVHLWDMRSPNPESLESWPLGWLYYRAAKTENSSGREYYLPLMPAARGALLRLWSAAYALNGGQVPSDAPIFSCPRSHGLTDGFRELQAVADVQTRRGERYQLEDFRKTVATYAGQVDAQLPHALCGWGASGIKERHYQQPEPLLVRRLHAVPLPECFAQYTDPLDVGHVERFVAKL